MIATFPSVQSLSHVRLFVTPWTAACQASLFIINSQSLLKFIPIELVMPSNHLILCCPLILPPSIFPSIRVFSNVPVLHIRWPKYLSFSFRINPFNEYSGLISFQMDWLDLLAVQGTLKSLLQHPSSKASILQCSASFFSLFLYYFICILYCFICILLKVKIISKMTGIDDDSACRHSVDDLKFLEKNK